VANPSPNPSALATFHSSNPRVTSNRSSPSALKGASHSPNPKCSSIGADTALTAAAEATDAAGASSPSSPTFVFSRSSNATQAHAKHACTVLQNNARVWLPWVALNAVGRAAPGPQLNADPRDDDNATLSADADAAAAQTQTQRQRSPAAERIAATGDRRRGGGWRSRSACGGVPCTGSTWPRTAADSIPRACLSARRATGGEAQRGVSSDAITPVRIHDVDSAADLGGEHRVCPQRRLAAGERLPAPEPKPWRPRLRSRPRRGR